MLLFSFFSFFLRIIHYLIKVWVSKIFFWEKWILLLSEGMVKLIKSKSKHIYNVTNHFYSKQMLFLWTFNSSKNPEKMYHGFHRNIIINQLFPALIKINVFQWINYIKKYIKIEILFYIVKKYTVFTVINKCILSEHERRLQKHKKKLVVLIVVLLKTIYLFFSNVIVGYPFH